MIWTCDAITEERMPKKMLHTKMMGKRPRGIPRTIWRDPIREYVEMRGENQEEIQDNRKWKNRDGWSFL